MADEYKIALEATIDDTSIFNLQTEVNNLSTKIKPIELKINTSNVESKIKSIRTQIEDLNKIKIDLGVGKSRGGVANISKETAAYKELLSIANQIDKLSLKTGGMKFNGADIKSAEADLERLRTRYNELFETLSSGKFGEGGFKSFKAQLSGVKAELTQLDTQLTQTQSKMVTGIKSDISNGTLGTQIIELERRFNALGVESQNVSNNITTLKSLLSSMDASDDIESVVSDYEVFKNTLTTTTNQVKALKREQSTINASNSLVNARTALSSNIDLWLQKNSAAAKQFGAELRNVQSQIATADNTQLGNLKAQFQEVTRQAKLAGVAGLSMGDQFKRSLQTVSSYLSAAMLISRAVMTVRNMYNEVLKVDTAMTGLKRVTTLTNEEYSKMYSDMIKSAKEYGATLSEIIDLTTSWVKLGFDSDVAERLAEISTMYQHVADIDTATATENLVTAYKGFQDTLDNKYGGDVAKAVEHEVDVLDKLNNEFAVTAADVGSALQRSASSLQIAGNTFEQSAGMATGITEVIQDAEKAGSTLNVVSLRLRGMKGQLEELGEEVDENVESISKMQTHILNLTKGKVNIFGDDGEFKSTYEIMKDIADVWDELDSKAQADLLETVAGKMRANAVSALISNFEQVEKATEAAYNSVGTAANENEIYMDSMAGKIAALEASWQSLSNTILSSDFLKTLIDGGKTIISGLDKINSLAGALPPILAVIFGYLSKSKNFGRTEMLVLNNKMPNVVIVLFGYEQFEYYRLLKYNMVKEV